jgi:hypothetical protein
MRKFLALAGALFTAGTAATPAFAESNSYEVQIRAHVPIECEADLSGSVNAVMPGSFVLGNISQFCNTPFQMSLMHKSLASPTAQLQFRNMVVPVGMGSTLIQPSAPATDGSAQLVLHGVDMAQAESFAASMVLSVTPLGV